MTAKRFQQIVTTQMYDCAMDGLAIRKADAADVDFAFAVKEAAFREYAEQVWGWDEVDQRELHEVRFAS